MRKRILNKFKNLVLLLFPDLFDEPNQISLVKNINFRNEVVNQPKILISYLTNIYFSDLKKGSGRTNAYEIIEIINVFATLGYCIDLISCNEIRKLKYIKDSNYDVIWGFGDVFYQMSNLQPSAKSILYMTEHHPAFSYEQEKLRNDYFFQRKGTKVKHIRSGMFYKIEHVQKKYDHIITLSETKPFEDQYEIIHTIFPTGIKNKSFVFSKKNHLITRKHFLWFGSSHAVHKGLDLLFDVFEKKDDIYLHVCGLNEEDRKFIKIPNKISIIDYGHIDVQSSLFLDIINKSSFIILPSCSEACSTGITTGMLHGLIPIVMKNTGFNRLDDKAIFLDDYKLDYLTDAIENISNSDPVALSNQCEYVYNWSNKNFTLSQFHFNFKSIIDKILC